jgi:hypothetical protein
MKIYYRGYVISKVEFPEVGFSVEGLRPERDTLAVLSGARSAMHWIDRDVIRHKVAEAGWYTPTALSA